MYNSLEKPSKMDKMLKSLIDCIKEEDYKAFRKAYNQSVKKNKAVFIYNGQEVLTQYAKYLLEYLENRFKKKKQN